MQEEAMDLPLLKLITRLTRQLLILEVSKAEFNCL